MRVANLALRFVLELCLLTALGFGGYAIASGPTAVALALTLPLAAAVAWGMFIAPRARRPTADPLRIVIESGLFGAAGAILLAADEPRLGIALWVAAAIHLALTFALDQRRPGMNHAQVG